MGLVDHIEKRMALGSTALDDSWYFPGGWFHGGASGGGKTKSGVSVSEFSAMQLAIVWCCIKILSEDSASLPLHLYRRLPGGGKERAVNHPAYSLLHDQPNPEMTAFSFREASMAHILSWGNSFTEKVYGRGSIGRSVVEELWPITPNRVTVKRNERREIVYSVSMSGPSAPVILPKRLVLHTPGLGFNGLVGYSPVSYFRECIGLGMALEEFGELYFGNGTHPGVVVSHPGKLSAQGHQNLETSLIEAHSGLGKSHRLLLLEEAMKIEKIGIPNNEAQFIETMKLSNVNIGTRIYRVPPYMYGEMDKTAFANVEQQAIDYVTKTLRPWLVRLEQSYNTSILNPEDRGEYFWEHLVDGMLRGDIKSRYEAYAVGRNNGWLNADEIREFENMNPMEGGQGKIYLVPLNMIPASEAGKVKEASAQQKSLQNQGIYRARLAAAYQRIFADAADRIIRKEVKRLRWITEKPGERGSFDEFYRDFGEYVEKQVIPAFMSYSEALIGMESELNGVELNGNRAQMQQFIANCAASYAQNHVKASRAALKTGDISAILDEWEAERADEIAAEQTIQLADTVLNHLKTLTGGQ